MAKRRGNTRKSTRRRKTRGRKIMRGGAWPASMCINAIPQSVFDQGGSICVETLDGFRYHTCHEENGRAYGYLCMPTPGPDSCELRDITDDAKQGFYKYVVATNREQVAQTCERME